MKFKTKVCIITGGASGIGLAIAKELGQGGGKIVISDLDDSKGKKAVDELHKENIECLFVKSDVTKEDDVRNLVQTTVSSTLVRSTVSLPVPASPPTVRARVASRC